MLGLNNWLAWLSLFVFVSLIVVVRHIKMTIYKLRTEKNDIEYKIENIVYNRAIKTRKENHVAKNLKLKMARVEHDMTQGDLADAIGVTRQTIGLIEAGKYNPTLSLCLAICKTLDKTLDQLFWE